MFNHTDAIADVSNWPPLHRRWRRLALWLWLAAILVVCTLSLTPNVGPPSAYGLDKLIHGASYLGLALLPHAAYDSRRTAVTAALCMIPLGIAVEWAQSFVPARVGDVWDAVANGSGAFLAITFGGAFRKLVGAVVKARG